MNPDFPDNYDPLLWAIDRLGNMQFIDDQAFADSDRLQRQWCRLHPHFSAGYIGAHP